MASFISFLKIPPAPPHLPSLYLPFALYLIVRSFTRSFWQYPYILFIQAWSFGHCAVHLSVDYFAIPAHPLLYITYFPTKATIGKMKPTFTRAAFLVVLLTPIQTVLAHRTVVVTVLNPVQSVYVTSTAEPVFVTVTRHRGSKDQPAAAASSSPSEAAPAASSQSSSPSLPPSSTPLIIQTSVTPPSSSATEAPVQTPEQKKISLASITPGTAPTINSSATTGSILSVIPSSIPSLTPSATKEIVQKSPSQTPLPTPIPTSTPAVYKGNPDSFTIAITNLYGAPLSLAFGSNDPGPKPDGNPEATVIGKASATTYTFPTGWAGRISVGKSISGSNSLIEASFPGEQWNSIDVSYVDGYSVPMTCSNNGQAVTGCNLDLWKQGTTCASPVDDGTACHNTAGDYGPAIQFFKPCEGVAYTYPKDDTATNGSVQGKEISCCIGTSCPSPANQKSYKRSLDGDVQSYPAHSHKSHQHLKRHQHHARSHVHQLVQEAKLKRWLILETREMTRIYVFRAAGSNFHSLGVYFSFRFSFCKYFHI